MIVVSPFVNEQHILSVCRIVTLVALERAWSIGLMGGYVLFQMARVVGCVIALGALVWLLAVGIVDSPVGLEMSFREETFGAKLALEWTDPLDIYRIVAQK